MKQAFEITIKSSDIPYAERRKKMGLKIGELENFNSVDNST